ncbi:disks large homolog 2 isoform X23 [Tachysurus ichikawai]
MTAHLVEQQSCCLEMHTREGDTPCGCGYTVSPAPAVPNMPRQRARLTASRSDGSWRSPSRNMMLRTKGGSCDLCWSECSCAQHGWRETYQVMVISSEN